MTIKFRIIITAAATITVTVGTLVAIAARESNKFAGNAKTEIIKSRDTYLKKSVGDVLALVQSQGEVLEQMVKTGVSLLKDQTDRRGKVVQWSNDKASWKAINQFTKEATQIQLPKVALGDKWLGEVSDPSVAVPGIDEAARIQPGSYTVFQRMNEKGEMIRVATNIINKQGKRAIGTYFPAVNPDGKPNAVVATISKGIPYQGVAFVVDTWCVTRYEPIFDSQKKVVGMLFSGQKQEKAASLKEAIVNSVIGNTGRFQVCLGKGTDMGKLLISGKSDTAANADDEKLKKWRTDLAETASKLEPGAIEIVPYTRDGQSKLVAYTYYKPWNWVIIADVPTAEFQAPIAMVQDGSSAMLRGFLIAGLILGCIGIGVAIVQAGSIALPAQDAISAMQKVSSEEADLTVRINANGTHEIAMLGTHFNKFLCRIETLMSQVVRAGDSTAMGSRVMRQAASEIQKNSKGIDLVASEIVSGSEQASELLQLSATSMNELNQTVEAIAQGAQEQAHRLSSTSLEIERIVDQVGLVTVSMNTTKTSVASAQHAASEGAKSVADTITDIGRIQTRTREAEEAIGHLGSATEKIDQIVQTIDDIAQQTNLLALNAAIEAARAGEHGRGFAVVADEVRKLAESASRNTKSITDLITEVKEYVSQSVTAIHLGSSEVELGRQCANQAGEALERIQQAFIAVSDQISEVANSTVKVQESASSVLDDITNLAAVTEETSASTEEMAATCATVTEQVSNATRVAAASADSSRKVTEIAKQTSDLVAALATGSEELDERARELAELVGVFKTTSQSSPSLKIAA